MRRICLIAIIFLLAAFSAAQATQTQIVQPRIDMEDLRKLQKSVDEGHQPWRLDPVGVACSEIGFPEDTRTCWRRSYVESPSDTEAIVTFAAASNYFVVYLRRLVRPDGIWTATRIEKTPTYEEDHVGLHYEPEVVTLLGRLTQTIEYGPPNYGENPESDSVEYPIILVLPRPVRVQGDPTSELNSETFANITQVQLVIDDGIAPGYSKYFERDVEVTGKLFAGHTGHHHTDVLITVETLTPAR
jgi:Domain of unknown function (DUF4431)